MKRATEWVSTLVPGDGDPRHGHNGYSNLGCRCDICRAAICAYNLGLRETCRRRLEKDPTLRPHGVPTTYSNWSCRCVPCTVAYREQARANNWGGRRK